MRTLGIDLGTRRVGLALSDADGTLADKLFIMANPKYGSEKKGAPTNYYLTVAPSQIKVNCELNHVDVVLCCDPKAFTHTNPLEGIKKGGSLVWESNEAPEVAWQRIPAKYRSLRFYAAGDCLHPLQQFRILIQCALLHRFRLQLAIT